tara:strand:+ start:954 stop:1196 length:243 start_codon:yes stop_codon:yes gene_type:complete
MSKRHIGRIEQILEDGQMNTHEILDEYMRLWPRATPLMVQLCNFLGKNKQFGQVGMETIRTGSMGFNDSYTIVVWELRRE